MFITKSTVVPRTLQRHVAVGPGTHPGVKLGPAAFFLRRGGLGLLVAMPTDAATAVIDRDVGREGRIVDAARAARRPAGAPPGRAEAVGVLGAIGRRGIAGLALN
jgi:hypothetical protein